MDGPREPDSFKVCLVGTEGVGKTAMLLRFLKGSFFEDDDPTIEDSHVGKVTLDNKECTLHILDTGGSHAYEHLHPKWFQWADAFVVMFNLSERYSFEVVPEYMKKIETMRMLVPPPKSSSVDNLRKELKKSGNANGKASLAEYSLVLIGTHSDCDTGERKVSREEAMEVAYQYGCVYLEVSAKTGENVERIWKEIVKEHRNKKQDAALLSGYSAMQLKKKDKRGNISSKFQSKEKREEKEKREQAHQERERDNALSILKDPVQRKNLCDVVPVFKVKPLDKKIEIVEVTEMAFRDYVSAQSVSTYPMKYTSDPPVRDGEPICDQFRLTHFESRTLVALADGCNWGEEPKKAAAKSVRIFTEYMKKHQKDITNTQEVAYMILRAFLRAHNKIIEGRTEETLYQAGTTTMIAGMLLELDDPNLRWGFVCVSLGDCKVYLISARTGEVTDITEGNRNNITDARDPGGRLGPYLDGGAPDLRNLKVFWTPCEQDDIFAVVSDGVHDNFDPQNLGKSPKDLNIPLKTNTWDELDRIRKSEPQLYAEAESIKNLFTKTFLQRLIGGKTAKAKTPSMITRTLIDHCVKVTSASREFMEKNPDKKLPPDYVKYPGKLDHTTSVAFSVGFKKQEEEKVKEDTERPQPVHRAESQAVLRKRASIWITCKTDLNDEFFFNTITRESSWESPNSDVRNSPWKAFYTEKGEIYYYNSMTHETSWTLPSPTKEKAVLHRPVAKLGSMSNINPFLQH